MDNTCEYLMSVPKIIDITYFENNIVTLMQKFAS